MCLPLWSKLLVSVETAASSPAIFCLHVTNKNSNLYSKKHAIWCVYLCEISYQWEWKQLALSLNEKKVNIIPSIITLCDRIHHLLQLAIGCSYLQRFLITRGHALRQGVLGSVFCWWGKHDILFALHPLGVLQLLGERVEEWGIKVN